MPAVKSQVELLRYTAQPEEIVAMGARLCYSDADIETLRQGVSRRDQGRYIEKLVDMGHLSPIEHASFTFGIEGVSRSLLAQITRHRIASFSVKSQRYVGAVGKGGDIQLRRARRRQGAGARGRRPVRAPDAHDTGLVRRMGKGNGRRRRKDVRRRAVRAAQRRRNQDDRDDERAGASSLLSLRCCNRAQWEIREVAWTMLGLAKKAAPNLFRNAGPGCVAGACTEGAMSCGRADEVLERMRRDFPD